MRPGDWLSTPGQRIYGITALNKYSMNIPVYGRYGRRNHKRSRSDFQFPTSEERDHVIKLLKETLETYLEVRERAHNKEGLNK